MNKPHLFVFSLLFSVCATAFATSLENVLVELDRVVIMGASLETDAFGEIASAPSPKVIAAENRILALTGRRVSIYQRAVSGANTAHMVSVQWKKFLEENHAFPADGKTLIIIGIGGNDITPNVPILLPNQNLINQRNALTKVTREIEAKGWDWCLLDLSWRDYNAPSARVDRAMGSWQWIEAVSRPINSSRRKLWNRTWAYENGTSWGDVYTLTRNNRQMLRDGIHFTSDGILKYQNYLINAVIVPAITGVPLPQVTVRDETTRLSYKINNVISDEKILQVSTTASHQGTAYIGIYMVDSTPNASEVMAGVGDGFVTMQNYWQDGNTIDNLLIRNFSGFPVHSEYSVKAVFVSDAGQISFVSAKSMQFHHLFNR